MSPPRKWTLEDLPPIAREEIEQDFAAYVDSRPPPARLQDLERRLREQVKGHDSGVHNIEELQRLLQKKIEGDAADKIAEERERRKEAQQELARVRERAEEDAREAARAARAEKLSQDALKAAQLTIEATEKSSRQKDVWKLFAALVMLVATALTTRFITKSPTQAAASTATESPR